MCDSGVVCLPGFIGKVGPRRPPTFAVVRPNSESLWRALVAFAPRLLSALLLISWTLIHSRSKSISRPFVSYPTVSPAVWGQCLVHTCCGEGSQTGMAAVCSGTTQFQTPLCLRLRYNISVVGNPWHSSIPLGIYACRPRRTENSCYNRGQCSCQEYFT